jgi:hypothetical protein
MRWYCLHSIKGYYFMRDLKESLADQNEGRNTRMVINPGML